MGLEEQMLEKPILIIIMIQNVYYVMDFPGSDCLFRVPYLLFFVCAFVCQIVCLFLCFFVCLFVCQLVSLFVCLFVCKNYVSCCYPALKSLTHNSVTFQYCEIFIFQKHHIFMTHLFVSHCSNCLKIVMFIATLSTGS